MGEVEHAAGQNREKIRKNRPYVMRGAPYVVGATPFSVVGAIDIITAVHSLEAAHAGHRKQDGKRRRCM